MARGVRSVHRSANPFFKFSVPCWANRKIWDWHLFRLIRLQCYKCLNCFCFKAPFYWNFIIWRRQRIFALKNNGKISKNCQNSRSPCFFSWIRKSYPSITKITQYLLFTVLCYLFPKKDKQNLTSVLSFFVFSKEETQKTKNEIRLPFYRFSFYVQTNTKNENEIRLPFYKQTHKTEKRKSTSLLSFLGFWKNRHKKRKNISRLPF